MHVYRHTYVYTYMHTYIHGYTCMYTYTYIYTCIYLYVCTYTLTYTRTQTHAPGPAHARTAIASAPQLLLKFSLKSQLYPLFCSKFKRGENSTFPTCAAKH